MKNNLLDFTVCNRNYKKRKAHCRIGTHQWTKKASKCKSKIIPENR